MKGIQTVLNTLALCLAASAPALAASTTTVYNSGILVLVFVGFCALVIVAQLIPAMITLWGMLRGIFSAREKDKEATAKARN